jgi:hypothetical protein
VCRPLYRSNEIISAAHTSTVDTLDYLTSICPLQAAASFSSAGRLACQDDYFAFTDHDRAVIDRSRAGVRLQLCRLSPLICLCIC